VAAWLVVCAPASAQDLFGIGARAAALGGATSARTGELSAVYYDPAAIVGPQTSPLRLQASFLYARPRLEVETFDGEAMEVPRSPDVRGLLLGTRFELSELAEGLGAALAIYVPLGDLFRWTLRPDDRVQWLMWTDRPHHISITVGLAYRITEWLGVGIGAQAAFNLQTNTTARITSIEESVDPDTGEVSFDVDAQLAANVTVYGRAAPTAGVWVQPHPRLRFALSYRGAIYVDDWGWTRIEGEPALGVIGYVHHFAHYFQPHQLTLGSFVDAGIATFSVDLQYNRWSRGLSRNHVELGAGRFGDTLTPSVGATVQVHPALQLLAGYRYERSPIDNVGGWTNLLDLDRHTASLGLELSLREWLGDHRILATFQLIGMPEREERKDWRRFVSDFELERNPGHPGYRYRGIVPAFWLAAEVSL